jgi:hypothetical protein
MRKARDPRECLFFVMNFSGVAHPAYRMGVPFPTWYRELMHTDAREFGGRGTLLPEAGVMADPIPRHGHPFSLKLTLPALSGLVLKPLPLKSDEAFDEHRANAHASRQGAAAISATPLRLGLRRRRRVR